MEKQLGGFPPKENVKVILPEEKIYPEDVSSGMKPLFRSMKIETFGDLASKTEDDFLENKLTTIKSLNELRDLLIEIKFYLTPTPKQAKLVEECEAAGIPFGKEELRKYIGHTRIVKLHQRLLEDYKAYPKFKEMLLASAN